ncbi:MAG: hypothetical protein GDA39_03535 [Hyphomonadaceae bacterium]|nr:hypothetical protein [Hyphomonadaceae bacterium]MBC6412020.1 hypothetical protein [Hyphomonadaceae bacterium]
MQTGQPDALVISFQNGIHNADIVKPQIPDSTVPGAVVPFNVTRTGETAFHCGTEGNLIVQNIDDVRLDHSQEHCKLAGQPLKRVADVRAVQ